MTVPVPKAICERCGKPAIVHITNDESGSPGIRHLCLDCAEAQADLPHAEPGLNFSALLISVGLFVLAISVFAEVLGFGSDEGFGWQQLVGLTVAGVLVLSGATIRIPTIVAIGLMIGGITILADYMDIGGKEGFGYKQIIGAALGGLLALAGVLFGRRRQVSQA